MNRGRLAHGPRGDTVLGSTLDFKESPLEFVRYVAKAYGDVARFRVLFKDWYLVSHPDLIWEAMTTQADVFLKPAVARRLWKPFLGDGLLTLEGDAWRRQHLLMKPAMHRARIDAYGDVMVARTAAMLDGWTEGEQRDLHTDFTRLTLEVICKTMFDADVSADASFVYDAMCAVQETLVEHIHMPLPVPRWWPTDANRHKVRSMEGMQEIVRRFIAERRASGEDRGDLLSMLVSARADDGTGLTDVEIQDQAMTLFFAGHETTANGLTWAWYALARHPDVVDRLTDELDRVLGGRPPTMADLRDLPYLEMTVKECLRYLPPVWMIMKEAIRDTRLGDWFIPKGNPILISPYVAHHDERFWPSPETFRPERFAREHLLDQPKGAYIPFSGGPRVCFGKSFAMAELRLVLATMLQRVVPEVPADHVPVKVAELSMHPRDGLPIVVRTRRPGSTLPPPAREAATAPP